MSVFESNACEQIVIFSNIYYFDCFVRSLVARRFHHLSGLATLRRQRDIGEKWPRSVRSLFLLPGPFVHRFGRARVASIGQESCLLVCFSLYLSLPLKHHSRFRPIDRPTGRVLSTQFIDYFLSQNNDCLTISENNW